VRLNQGKARAPALSRETPGDLAPNRGGCDPILLPLRPMIRNDRENDAPQAGNPGCRLELQHRGRAPALRLSLGIAN